MKLVRKPITRAKGSEMSCGGGNAGREGDHYDGEVCISLNPQRKTKAYAHLKNTPKREQMCGWVPESTH